MNDYDYECKEEYYHYNCGEIEAEENLNTPDFSMELENYEDKHGV
ncbi:MAG: hypothetical protein ACTSR1_00170 [Candidatus Heimdallarchaeota archaeon]